jgi:hypothetical protein
LDPFDVGEVIKIDAKVCSQGHYVAFRMATAAIPGYLCAGICGSSRSPRPPPGSRIDGKYSILMSSRESQERYVLMPTRSPLSGALRVDRVHRREGWALSNSVERGNLSLDKAVVQCTSGGGPGGANPLFLSFDVVGGRSREGY